MLLDTARVESSFAAVDFFARRRTPFVVGVNCFDGRPRYTPDEVRHALHLSDVPVLLRDARSRECGR